MIDDETLMAYADGELDAPTRDAVQRAIADDPQLAERVRRHQALRGRVSAAFEPVLREPVPPSLIDALGDAGTTPGDSKVVDLAAQRAAKTAERPRQGPRRWSWPEWGAMAACLMVGVVAGPFALSALDAGPFETSAGQLVARGGLERALSKQPAGAAVKDGKVAIQLSFVSAGGEYCRSFALHEENALAGLACRTAGQWRVQVLVRDDSVAAAGYRQAGSASPAAVLRAIDERMRGQPLDAQAEQAAIARGWRRP